MHCGLVVEGGDLVFAL